MTVAAYFGSCLLLGTVFFCHGILEKRQTTSACSIDTFNCTDASCIDLSLTCDGRKDCSDGSDETRELCASTTCPNYAFQCKYGACVPKIAKCNGKEECADGSDEKLTECLTGPTTPSIHTSNCQLDEYRCKSGQCIDDALTCDGSRDCSDGTDETVLLCRNVQCPNYSYKCNYGACVSKSSRCDGVKQCIDGSDENECSRPKPKPTPTVHPQPPATSTISQTNNIKTTCVIPAVVGSVYSFNDSNRNAVLSPGTHVTQYRLVEQSCEKEYYKTGPNRFLICTETGQWLPDISDKLCLKKCPPMVSDSLDIKCIHNGENVDCSKPSVPGTKLKPKCKVTHTVQNGQVETPIELLCLSDGNWSGGLYSCVPYCGRTTIKSDKLILNGSKAQYGTAPWNVAIYRQNNGVYNMICGGTLISPNLVVSAAHCFWQEGLTDRILMNDGTYKIAVGKYSRNISLIDNEFTQIMDVGFIFLNEDYQGVSGFHAGDIAVILLPNKVNISTVVAPACVDWTNRYSVSSGSTGKIVGWGKTEKMIESPYLLEAALPYINQVDCRKMYTNGFHYFVTPDKFCAGSQLGQGVHEGDSGAGLTYVHNTLHHLTGVVSVKDPNPHDAVAVFTDVKHHIEWITELYTNYTYVSESRITKSAVRRR